MSGIDVLFQLFALLLGFSLAELLAGLARSWRIRVGATRTGTGSIRIGWLVPLLALLLSVDQTHFWLTSYVLRGLLTFDYVTLLGILFIVGGYYVISTFVFPDDPEHWRDFDDYYFKIKKTVLFGMVSVNLATIAYVLWSVERTRYGIAFAPVLSSWTTIIPAFLFLPGLMILAMLRSPRSNGVMLVIMNILLLGEALAQRFASGP